MASATSWLLQQQQRCSEQNDDTVGVVDRWAPPTSQQRNADTQLRRIHNPQSRQVTFCKRRKGLFKKALELSVMCDAEIGIIVFSPSGKLSEFATPTSSLPKIIKRYGEHALRSSSNQIEFLQEVEFWRNECIRLRQQIISLSKTQSDMLGEGDTSLELNNMIFIEQNLYNALNKIHKRKIQLMRQDNEQIHQKVRSLEEENGFLRLKLAELSKMRMNNF